MCADFFIHGTETENPHAHILLTMRPFTEDSTWGTKFKNRWTAYFYRIYAQ